MPLATGPLPRPPRRRRRAAGAARARAPRSRAGDPARRGALCGRRPGLQRALRRRAAGCRGRAGRLARRAGRPSLGRPHDVRVTARSGGHSYAGYSTLDKGVVVDLRRLDGIAVDAAAAPRASAPARTRSTIVDALARHGGAVPARSCPTVGLGGLALGGGYGLAARAWGLTADNVTRITVITPDGRLRRVDRRHDADLFWALRGGGGGNFGIATRFELRVHRAAPPPGSAARSRRRARSRAWQAWAPETDPRLTSLLQLGSNGSVDVLGQYLGSERSSTACSARCAAPAPRSPPARRPTARCRSGGPTGARRRARRSRRSRTTSPARCPRRTREALVAELARRGSCSTPPRRLRRRAEPPPRPRHRLRPPRRPLLDPVPHLETAARRPRGLRRLHRHRRAVRRGRLPELHGPRAQRLAPRLLRPQPAPAGGGPSGYDPDRRFRFPRAI